MDKTLPKLIEIIQELVYHHEQLTAATTFDGDLGFDSLDEIELVMCIEENFDIEVDEQELVEVKTVGELADFINKIIGSKGATC